MKLKLFIVVLFFSFVLISCQGKKEAGEMAMDSSAEFHIGVVTGTVSQSEDELRGAEELIRRHGSVADGGMVQHLTYPDNFTQETETTVSQIASLADDPLMKAVIVHQGVPGTSEGMRRIREVRPDILLLIGEAQEDPNVVTSVADVVTNADYLSRGYTIIRTAKEMGATKFVHVSFPRHMGIEVLSRRREIMMLVAADMGIEFINQSAPDPTTDVGVAGAQAFVLEQVPTWVEQYGQDTAFFTTNDALTEPLIKQILEYGGYFVEPDLPSPLMGYPGALGIDLTDVQGDFPAMIAKEEAVLEERGGSGRFGTWVYSNGFTTTVALGEHAINVINGESVIDSKEDVVAAYDVESPEASWNAGNNIDFGTDTVFPNHFLMFQDTYIFGKGPAGNTEIDIPESYFYLQGVE